MLTSYMEHRIEYKETVRYLLSDSSCHFVIKSMIHVHTNPPYLSQLHSSYDSSAQDGKFRNLFFQYFVHLQHYAEFAWLYSTAGLDFWGQIFYSLWKT